MTIDTEVTRVLFRRFRGKDGGDVIAMFPDHPGTNSPYTCESYQHMGQHCWCDTGIVRRETKPARMHEADVMDLFNELTRIGYRLQVRQRIPSDSLSIRKQTLKT